MEIYLINAETNEVIQTYTNVVNWAYNFVVYDNNGYLGKIYCEENEFFTDKKIEDYDITE